MYDILDQDVPLKRHSIALPRWVLLKSRLLNNLMTVQSYYAQNPTYLNSDHLLINLIHMAPMHMKSDLDYQIRLVREVVNDTASAFKLTSPTTQGTLHDGDAFYGEAIKEAIILSDSRFNEKLPWRLAKPVRILYHPFTELSMELPLGQRRKSKTTGYAVIEINYPMLIWMFRQWFVDPISKVNEDSHLPVSDFITRWVIPNALESHLDIAIFNRLQVQMFGGSIPEDPYRHHFQLVDFGRQVNEVLGEFVEIIERRDMSFDELMTACPLVEHDNLFTLFEPPNMLKIKQNSWALVLARLKLFEMLLGYDYLIKSQRNLSVKYELKRWIRMYLLERRIPSSLPSPWPEFLLKSLKALDNLL